MCPFQAKLTFETWNQYSAYTRSMLTRKCEITSVQHLKVSQKQHFTHKPTLCQLVYLSTLDICSEEYDGGEEEEDVVSEYNGKQYAG